MMSYERIVNRVCNRTCDRFCFFDQKIAVEKLTGLKLLAERLPEPSSTVPCDKEQGSIANYVSSMDKFSCQLCDLDFPDAEAMREHFKSDSHVLNINLSLDKSKMANFFKLNTVGSTETLDYSSLKPENSTNSPKSIQDPTESCPLLGASSHKQMVYFRSRDSEIIGIHRCVLYTRKTLPKTMDELLSNVVRLRQSRRWAVLLYSGGKFAGGIFDGLNEVVHKTLQHYTVRAKQGGSQSAYDASTSGMGGAKSAGASLRRHGELAIRAEISHLLHNRWRAQLQACQFILVWSPKVHRKIFFNTPFAASNGIYPSGSTPSSNPQNDPTTLPCPEPDPFAAAACQAGLGMTPDDIRVRRIPCRTNEITYSHVKELHKEFSSFYVYDGHANFTFLSQSKRQQLRSLSESGDDTLLETRSGRMVYGPLSLLEPKPDRLLLTPPDDSDQADEDTEDEDEATDSSELDEAMSRLSIEPTTIHTEPDTQSDEPKLTDEQVAQKQMEELYSMHHNWHRRVRVAIASGDQVALRSLLPEIYPRTADSSTSNEAHLTARPTATESHSVHSPNNHKPSAEACSILLNYPLAEGRTLLHVAVEFQQEPEVVSLLLESGCDPALRDAEGKTPYVLSVNQRKKQLATVFRRFRFYHPDRYDYDKAQIPPPLDPTTEAQKAERERERARKQRQRRKERKADERVKLQKEKAEAEEKARFMALSDREKRALVTERRLLSAQSAIETKSQVFNRCFQCGCDISGKVPFTYMDFNFCTPACLKAHRLSTSRPS